MARTGLSERPNPIEVGRDDPQAGVDEHRHDVAVEVGPGRLAVQQQHDRAVGRTLVEVVHPQRRVRRRPSTST